MILRARVAKAGDRRLGLRLDRALAALVLLCLVPACVGGRAQGRARRGAVIEDAPLRFVFMDLGQADALLVWHRGKTLLVDAGESRHAPDASRYRGVVRRIEQLTGKRHVDHLVATHYHRDHVGFEGPDVQSGLFALLAQEGLTAGTLWDRGAGSVGDKGEVQRAWERALPGWLASGRVGMHRAAALGDTLDLGDGLRVEVVAVNGNGRFATVDDHLRAWPPSENDSSVALKFTSGDFELFSGGDLTGATVERAFGLRREGYHDVESSTAPRVGDVEVYRADHHGSGHSSNPCLVSTLRPEVSIISTGENSYGHPDLRVVKALRQHGLVFITSGADARVRAEVAGEIVGGDVEVHVAADGRRYTVNGWPFRSKTEADEAAGPASAACAAGEWRGAGH
jgi:beta-lactamase superfamily II metal-dependent hydrolase